MKKFVLFAAVAALSACSGSEEPTPAATEDTAAAPAEPAAFPTTAADGQPDAGTYDVTAADGSVSQITLGEDGSVTHVAGDQTMQGTFTKTGPLTYCVTMEGDTAATCYTDTMDGEVWHMTNDADPEDVYTITRKS